MVDALASGASVSNNMEVQVLSRAPIIDGDKSSFFIYINYHLKQV